MTQYVYSPRYHVDLGGHVFPTQKYARIAARLSIEDRVAEADLLEPEPATADEITTVHTQRYFEACRDGTLSPGEIARLELPWSASLFDAAARCVGGTIMAVELALVHGAGMHIGGGFHHAFPDHGEGFCMFNDIACALAVALARGRIERALVVDCDLHHGNGTAAIFAAQDRVRTYSIHEQGIYPLEKPPSDVDVGLDFGADDDRYLAPLRESLSGFVAACDTDLVLYVAGADPFAEDQLGGLQLSKAGLRARDEYVTGLCRERDWPLVVVLAGGYARDPEDTADIHLATVRIARQLWR